MKTIRTSIRVVLAMLTFAIPLTQVPGALASASVPEVATFFPIHEFSNADEQHFFLMFDKAVSINSGALRVSGTAQNCVITPFSRIAMVIDVAVTNCSDGDLVLRLLPDTVGDPVEGVGPALEYDSQAMHISRAIPNFAIGGWRETQRGSWEFHLAAPTGALRVDATAFEFSSPTCSPSVYQQSAFDYVVTVTGCPTATPVTVAIEPYSFFDWYANAGPATRVQSLPVVLTAAAVVPPTTPSPTTAPTLGPSPVASPSSSPSASLTPGTATLAQMLGLGQGSPAPDVQVTSVPVVAAPPSESIAAPETELTVLPTTQDEPLGSELTARDFAPPSATAEQAPSLQIAPTLPVPNYSPVNLATSDNDIAMKWAGAGVIALACVILLIGGWRFMKTSGMRKTNARRLRVRVS